MSETVFQTSGLSKKYGGFYALNKVDMRIKKGDIYGFVGENGAGKTTLIRILAGTAFKTDGEISHFGVRDADKIHKMRRRIGGIIENPAVYPNLSAEDNLEIVRLQLGISDKACIRDILDIVGLSDTGRKKAKNFSLGMRQRLGLAISLIGDPEFLVLDEPVNGLDPAGIVEFRNLIKKLNIERGITILISSHILSELYQLATCYGFIHKGQMLEQITLEELDDKCKRHILIRVNDNQKAAEVIQQKLHASNIEILSDGAIKLYDFDDSQTVAAALFENGVALSEIYRRGEDLEQYYMHMIGGARNV